MNEPVSDIMAGYYGLVKGITALQLTKASWSGDANLNKLTNDPEDEENEKWGYMYNYMGTIDDSLARLPPYYASSPWHETIRSKLKMLKAFIIHPPKGVGLESMRYCRAQLERFQRYYNRPLLSSRQMVEAIETIFDKAPILPVPNDYDKESSYDIPLALQREVSQLDEKFTVSLDGTAPSYSKTVQLVCYLYDDELPCVPPIGVHIPENYPFISPICSFEDHEYSTTSFLLTVQYALTARLAMMPARYSLTHILNAWELSVRQACSPNDVAIRDFNAIFGI